MSRPIELAVKLGWYMIKNRYLMGRKKFPLVTMLEPLEACNLACEGCGRIREYESVIDRLMTVDQCLKAVNESDAPIVSIAGGEPTMHPNIDEIVAKIIAQKRFVYMCTNALLMERIMKKIPASKYFCFVVHMDGMEEAHDISVYRKGVWKIATRAMKIAIENGYRVTSNTTIFNGVDENDMLEMFKMLTDMGVEGCMVSPGYQFDSVPNQDLFISRKKARNVFTRILDPKHELIKYKGFQVPPAELEGLLVEHPDASDAAVIGKEDEESGDDEDSSLGSDISELPEDIWSIHRAGSGSSQGGGVIRFAEDIEDLRGGVTARKGRRTPPQQ